MTTPTISTSISQNNFVSAAFVVSSDIDSTFSKYDIRVVPLEFSSIGSDALATTVNMQGLIITSSSPALLPIPINNAMQTGTIYKATLRLYSSGQVRHTSVGVFYYDTRTFTVDSIGVSSNPNPNYSSESDNSPHFSHSTPVIKATDYETDPENAVTVTLNPSGNGNDGIFNYVKFDKVCMSCTNISPIAINPNNDDDVFDANAEYYLGEQPYLLDHTYKWQVEDADADISLPSDRAYELWGYVQLALSDSFPSLPDSFITPTFAFGFDIVAHNDTVGYHLANPAVSLTLGDVVGTVSEHPIKITLTNFNAYDVYKFQSITLKIRESDDLSSGVLFQTDKNYSDFVTVNDSKQVVFAADELADYVNAPADDTEPPIVNLVDGQLYHFEFILNFTDSDLYKPAQQRSVVANGQFDDSLLPITAAYVENSWEVDPSQGDASQGDGLVISFKKTDQFLGSRDVPYNLDMHGPITVLAEYSVSVNEDGHWNNWLPLAGGFIAQGEVAYTGDASNSSEEDGIYNVPQSSGSDVGAAQPDVKIYAVIPNEQANYKLVKVRLTLSTDNASYSPAANTTSSTFYVAQQTGYVYNLNNLPDLKNKIDQLSFDTEVALLSVAGISGQIDDPETPESDLTVLHADLVAANNAVTDLELQMLLSMASFRYFPQAPVHDFASAGHVPFIHEIHADVNVADITVPVSVPPYFQAVMTSSGTGDNFGSADLSYDYNAADVTVPYVPYVDDNEHNVTGFSYPISFVGDTFNITVKYVYLENTSIETAVETKTIQQQGLLPIITANVVNSWQVDASPQGAGLVVSFKKTDQFMGNSADLYNLDLAANQASVLAEYSITHNGVDWTTWTHLAGGSITQEADPVYELDENNTNGVYAVPLSDGSAVGAAQPDVKIYAVIPGEQANYKLVKVRLTLSTGTDSTEYSPYSPLIDITVADPHVPIGTSETYAVPIQSGYTYPIADASFRYFPEAPVHDFARAAGQLIIVPFITAINANADVTNEYVADFSVPVSVPPYFKAVMTADVGNDFGIADLSYDYNADVPAVDPHNVTGFSYPISFVGDAFNITVKYVYLENTSIETAVQTQPIQQQGLLPITEANVVNSWQVDASPQGAGLVVSFKKTDQFMGNSTASYNLDLAANQASVLAEYSITYDDAEGWTEWVPLVGGSITQEDTPDYEETTNDDGIYAVPLHVANDSVGAAQPDVKIYAVIPGEQANYKLVKVRLTLSTGTDSTEYTPLIDITVADPHVPIGTSETYAVPIQSGYTYPIADASFRYFPEAPVHDFARAAGQLIIVPFITAINANADVQVADITVPVSVPPYFQAVVTSSGSGGDFGSADPYDYNEADVTVPYVDVDPHNVTGLSYPISFDGDTFEIYVKYVYLENTSIETESQTKLIQQQGLLPIITANVVNSWQVDASPQGAGLVVSFKKTAQFMGGYDSTPAYNLDLETNQASVLAEYSITYDDAEGWTEWVPLVGGSITQEDTPDYEETTNDDGIYAVPLSDGSADGADQPDVKIYAVIPGEQANYKLVKVRLTLSTASTEYTPLINITVADPHVPIGTSETYAVPIQSGYTYPIADASFRYFPEAPVHDFARAAGQLIIVPFITAINANADVTNEYVADFTVPVSVPPYFQAVVTSSGTGDNFGSADPYDYNAADVTVPYVPYVDVDPHNVTGLSYPISFVGDAFNITVKYVYLENTSIETDGRTKLIQQQGLLPITEANVVNSWQLNPLKDDGLVVSFSKTAQFMGNSTASYNLDLAANQATVLAEYSITYDDAEGWTEWVPLIGGSITQEDTPDYEETLNTTGVYAVPLSDGSAVGAAQPDVKIYAVIPNDEQNNYKLVKVRLTLSTDSTEYTPLISIADTVANPPVPIGTSETHAVLKVETATYPIADASFRYFPLPDAHAFSTYKPIIDEVDSNGNVKFNVPVHVPPYFSSSVTTSGGTVNGPASIVSNSNGNSVDSYCDHDVTGLSYAPTAASPTVASSFQLTVAYTCDENTAIDIDGVPMTVQMQGFPSGSFTIPASSWDRAEQQINYTLAITATSTTAHRMDGWNMYTRIYGGSDDWIASALGNLLKDDLSQTVAQTVAQTVDFGDLEVAYPDYTRIEFKFVATRSLYLDSSETSNQQEGGEAVTGSASDIQTMSIIKLPAELPAPTANDIVVANIVYNKTSTTPNQSGTLTVSSNSANIAQIKITDPDGSDHYSSSSNNAVSIALPDDPTPFTYTAAFQYDQYVNNVLKSQTQKESSSSVTVTFTTGTSERPAPVITQKTRSEDGSFDLSYTSSNSGTPSGDIASVAYVKHASAVAVNLGTANGTGNVAHHQSSEVVLYVIDTFNTDYSVTAGEIVTPKETDDQDIQSPNSLNFYLAANPKIDEESIVVLQNSTQSVVRFSVNNNGAPMLHQVVLAVAQDSTDSELDPVIGVDPDPSYTQPDPGYYALCIFEFPTGFVVNNVAVPDTLGSDHTLKAISIAGEGMGKFTRFEFASSTLFASTAANTMAYVKNNVEGADSASFSNLPLMQMWTSPVLSGTVAYATVSSGNYTATATYTFETGVSAIKVMKSDATTIIASQTVSLGTATITIPYTTADITGTKSFFVVALGNGSVSESPASASQRLYDPLNMPPILSNFAVGTKSLATSAFVLTAPTSTVPFAHTENSFTPVGQSFTGLPTAAWNIANLVRISADGTAIGIVLGTSAGTVRMYKLINNVWTQWGGDITGTANGLYAGVSQFDAPNLNLSSGSGSFSMSADGTLLTTVQTGLGTFAGLLNIYKYDVNKTTAQTTNANLPTYGPINWSRVATMQLLTAYPSVVISADGKTIAVSDHTLRMYCSDDGGATWTQKGGNITDTDTEYNSFYYTISISANGLAVLAAPKKNGGDSKYMCYEWDGLTWNASFIGNFNWIHTISNGAISADGKVCVIHTDNFGHRFTKNVSGVWTPAPTINFFKATFQVNTSADGTFISFGAYGDNPTHGDVDIHRWNGSAYVPVIRYRTIQNRTGDAMKFNAMLSADGTRIVVGGKGKVDVYDLVATGKMTYSSSAPAVASVHGHLVLMNSVGTSTITATQTNAAGSAGSITGRLTITS